MLLGHIDLVDRREIRGRAVDTDRPFKAVDVAVFVDGRLVGVVSADQAPGDLCDSSSFGPGLHGLTYFFDRPLAADQDHDVVVRFVEGGKLLGQWHIVLEGVLG